MSILRSATQKKHEAVEALPFVQYLLHGNITTEHYIVYLAEMCEIYRHLEFLALHAGLFDNMPELPRTARIQADLEELAPGYATEITDATRRYLQHLSDLADSNDPRQLFAHVYVRHLGDMYGGKLISRVVPGTGRWYEFDNRADLVKRFNAALTEDLTAEALVGFDHFGNIFQDLWNKIHTG